GEGELDVERGRRRVAQRSAGARQQVQALASHHHLAVHPAVVTGVRRGVRALADAPQIAAATRYDAARADLGERRAQVNVGEEGHEVTVREIGAGLARLEVERARQVSWLIAVDDAYRHGGRQQRERCAEGRAVERARTGGAGAGALEGGRAVASAEAVA